MTFETVIAIFTANAIYIHRGRNCSSSAGRLLDLWLKGHRFESWQKQQKKFLVQSEPSVLTLIQCPLHSCVTAVASTFILPKALVAGYTQTCIHPSPNQWADYAVEAQCGNWAHTQLIREHSSTVVSTCWATVDLPGLKSGIGVRQLTSTKSAGWEWPLNRPSKSMYAKKKSLPHSHLKDASICKIKPYYVQLFAIVIRSSFRMWAWLK